MASGMLQKIKKSKNCIHSCKTLKYDYSFILSPQYLSINNYMYHHSTPETTGCFRRIILNKRYHILSFILKAAHYEEQNPYLLMVSHLFQTFIVYHSKSKQT